VRKWITKESTACTIITISVGGEEGAGHGEEGGDLGVVNKKEMHEELCGRVRGREMSRIRHSYIPKGRAISLSTLVFVPSHPPRAPTLPQLEFSDDQFPQVQTTLQASSFDHHSRTSARHEAISRWQARWTKASHRQLVYLVSIEPSMRETTPL
jgi:hypothetical protein